MTTMPDPPEWPAKPDDAGVCEGCEPLFFDAMQSSAYRIWRRLVGPEKAARGELPLMHGGARLPADRQGQLAIRLRSRLAYCAVTSRLHHRAAVSWRTSLRGAGRLARHPLSSAGDS